MLSHALPPRVLTWDETIAARKLSIVNATTSAPIEGAIRSGLATASQTLERQE